MKAIIKAPGQKPQQIVIPNDLHTLQELVGGYIEAVTINEDPKIVIICDEEGRLADCEYNCEVMGINFVGTILFLGADGDEFADCPISVGLAEELCGD